MEDKKAIEILLGIVEKYSLSKEEKEAIHAAIGILSWTSLAKNRLKGIKEKKDRKIEKSMKW